MGKRKKMVTFAGHDCFDSIYIARFSLCSTDCLADTRPVPRILTHTPIPYYIYGGGRIALHSSCGVFQPPDSRHSRHGHPLLLLQSSGVSTVLHLHRRTDHGTSQHVAPPALPAALATVHGGRRNHLQNDGCR